MARSRDSNSAIEAPSGEKSSSRDLLPGPLGDPLVTVGFLALGLPLFLHLNVAQTLNSGAANPTRIMDYVAICGGVVADTAGMLLLLKAIMGRGAGNPSKTPVRIAVALIISALGIVHLLRGLGLIKLGLLG